jgi:hypothetical protein
LLLGPLFVQTFIARKTSYTERPGCLAINEKVMQYCLLELLNVFLGLHDAGGFEHTTFILFWHLK